jgi:hypothetical protein
MSIEQEIHAQWAGDAALVALVPASRLFTGFATGEPTLPYVVIDDHCERAHVRVSQGSVADDVELTFQIYTDDLDDSKAIAMAMLNQFDRSSFALTAGTVLSMQAKDYREQLHDDGVWQLSAKYVAIVEPN